MAWNRPSNKSLQSDAIKASQIGPGAPISVTPGMSGRAYKDGWDIQRVYQEAYQKVTWVFRCIDVIAGNQAKLPVMLRRGNSPVGEIVRSNSPVLKLLNQRANRLENAFTFRKRVSSQLLMSTRGVFIEKVRDGRGNVVALNLLPPEYTAPVPDTIKTLLGFEIRLPTGAVIELPPDDVLWIRNPHPLNPYLSVTPMDSVGLAVEIENLAKQYNRNFLLHDGRPGMLINVRSEMDIDDRHELESRFAGGTHRAGKTTVLASENGIDVLDMAASPRDSAYVQMRDLTKNEILGAFGVPEPALGNSSGRTFSNASEEMRGFWMETMLPHLELLARAFDELDEAMYVGFDTSNVPVLVLMEQERNRFHMEEFEKGVNSVNEYRKKTGQKECDSELADSLLVNPALTPIANTKKKFVQEPQVDPNAPPGAPLPVGPAPEPAAAPETAALEPEIEAALAVAQYQVKVADAEATTASERWIEIMDHSLERLFERQQRVVTEKATGPKARRNQSVDAIFDSSVWNKQIEEDIRPLVKAITEEAAKTTFVAAGADAEFSDVESEIAHQMNRIKKVNETTKSQIAEAFAAYVTAPEGRERDVVFKGAIMAIFLNLLMKRKRVIAEHEALTAWNSGVFAATKALGPSAVKTWVSQGDSDVRSAHVELDGKSVPVLSPFQLKTGTTIRYPGDPLAPPELTVNCRCRLRFGGLLQ